MDISPLKHDKSVTENDASKMLDEIAKGEVLGPWVFTIDEIKR